MRPSTARFAHLVSAVGILALGLLGAAGCASRSPHRTPSGFVTASGIHLMLDGRRFYFAGVNADYVPHRDRAGAALDLHNARADGFTVVRMFGFNDGGNPAARRHTAPTGYQYWSPTAGSPVFNDGPTPGLGGLDYAIYQARRDGLHVVVPFVNNWNAYGGMDAYVCWLLCRSANSTGGCAYRCYVGYHDDFYTNPIIVSWFRSWIAHLLNHVNVYTHIAYKNDPTILAWQLANEPRCDGGDRSAYPRSPRCTPDGTILPWVKAMASYVKSIDPHHLLAVGDEGFLCAPKATDYTDNCGEGDSVKYTRVPGIDFMSFHDYPLMWERCPSVRACVNWGDVWIKRHIAAARAVGKPAVLDEFGLVSGQLRVSPEQQSNAYRTWTGTVNREGAAGDMVWSLAPSGGLEADGPYGVSCPSMTCAVLTAHATVMAKK